MTHVKTDGYTATVSSDSIREAMADLARPRDWSMQIVLPAALYDRLEAEGASMTGYVRQEPMPRVEP